MTKMHEDAARWPAVLGGAQSAALDFLKGLPARPVGVRSSPSSPSSPPSPPSPPAPLELPEAGLGAEGALALFRRRHEERLSGSPGPRYLGFVTGGSTPAAVAGDWLVSAYDQNVSNAGDSSATAVEHEALQLLRELFGLPQRFEGAFVSGATQANLVGLATARQWAAARLGVDVSEAGLWALPRIPVLAGAPHASIYKALAVLGMGRSAVELIACLKGREAIDPAALGARLAALGGHPAIVVASAGTVNTGDFDDLEALTALGHRHGAWVHVDGAFGLFAACDPDRAHLLRGLSEADSIATDGHKWLNVPYDSGVAFTRHLALQEQVFKAVAAYLGTGPDLLHRTPENSRRFRALPAWMTLMAYGREAHRALVRRCCAIAQAVGRGIEASPDFTLMAPVRLNIVCFRLSDAWGGDALATRDRFLSALQADGRILMTPTQFDGRPGLRAAFVNWSTTEDDGQTILIALREVAAALKQAGAEETA